jgi:hypothetical protein
VKTISIVECVACFVAHDSKAVALSATFDLEHLLALESSQPWVCQVEGYCKTGDFVWGEPLFGEPDMRLEAQAVLFEFLVKY